MSTYIPHTDEDRREMLSFLGLSSVKELFLDIPVEILEKEPMGIPTGISEHEALGKMKKYADKNKTDLISFMGCGSYDHIIPAAIDGLISRGEFLTAYTPYQAEISQGILQAIFEFQSMICELNGMDVSNASLYDGHTAIAEAAVIGLNSGAKKDTILYSSTLHPHTIQVLQTFFADLPVFIEEIPEVDGETDLGGLESQLGPNVACVILQTPNVYGILEDYTGVAEKLNEYKSLFIVSSNPVSLGLMKPPGEWGAHIGVGDLQPFGLSPCYGGPSVGYMAASKKYMRKLPGRISGQTLDKGGLRSYVLTLQAREQHIKRERATSNICSNQALAAIACTIHMSLIGKEGLKEVASQCTAKAHYLQDKITKDLSISLLHNKPFFHEFTLELPCEASKLVKDMTDNECFLAGVDLGGLKEKAGCSPSGTPGVQNMNLLTIAVTEKRSRLEMDEYVSALGRSLKRMTTFSNGVGGDK
ncbi:MAG: aminomethyl-transferring glycine dehydrogenase subunit GcvPA [Spirochaetales bacterium]|nr:aminomethyl-transferring glycine dehydrogenase subunit GcvPA [Spirochaetales bacterium]